MVPNSATHHNSEIQKLLDKGFIVKCDRDNVYFVSTVFTGEKRDGSFRTILNLKYLNRVSKRCTQNNRKGCVNGQCWP